MVEDKLEVEASVEEALQLNVYAHNVATEFHTPQEFPVGALCALNVEFL